MADEMNVTTVEEVPEEVTLTEFYIEYPNGKKVKAKIVPVPWMGEVETIEEDNNGNN